MEILPVVLHVSGVINLALRESTGGSGPKIVDTVKSRIGDGGRICLGFTRKLLKYLLDKRRKYGTGGESIGQLILSA